MKYVFVLQHTHVYSEDDEDTKFIGVYKSKENAEVAIEKLKTVTGFNKCPSGFCIDKYEIGKTFWQEGYAGE